MEQSNLSSNLIETYLAFFSRFMDDSVSQTSSIFNGSIFSAKQTFSQSSEKEDYSLELNCSRASTQASLQAPRSNSFKRLSFDNSEDDTKVELYDYIGFGF